MLSLSSKHRYYMYGEWTDMRKGFDGLSGLVARHFESELLSGDVFIFMNKRRDRVKMLSWERTGFAIYYKRLERGCFEMPEKIGGNKTVELSWSSLVMLLEGIELKGIKKRKRFGIKR